MYGRSAERKPPPIKLSQDRYMIMADCERCVTWCLNQEPKLAQQPQWLRQRRSRSSNVRVRCDLIRDQQQVDSPFAGFLTVPYHSRVSVSRAIVGRPERCLPAPDVPVRLSLPIVRATSSKTSDHVPPATGKPRSRFLPPDFRRDVVSELPQQTGSRQQ